MICPLIGIGDERQAVLAGTLGGKKLRQHVEGDVDGGAAEKLAVPDDRHPRGYDRIAGVRVERRFGDEQRAGVPRRGISRQLPDIERRRRAVLGDVVRPHVEEGAMTAPIFRADGEIVDVARVPVGVLRNLRIGALAIVVDPGDDAMVAVLEADIGGVDLVRRCQNPIERVAAVLGSEVGRLGRRRPRPAGPACRRRPASNVRRFQRSHAAIS